MENVKNLQVIFSGNTTSLSTAFAQVNADAAKTQGELKSLGTESTTLGSKFGAAAATITKGLAVTSVVVAAAAIKMAANFQQQMTYIRTDAGDTTDNINTMGNAILRMTSQFDPTQLAQGMYHLASLGLRGADAMNALNIAQKMASVGGANLEDTTSALGAALVTGIKGVQDYSQAAGTLDAIVGAGNMRMQDLVAALGTGVLPVFKNAGLSITDFGAALATLTDNGMHADEAATRLKMTISLMEAPSAKAQKVLADIGLTSNQIGMDMQTKGLIPALQDLNQHLLTTFGTTAEGKQQTAQALTEMFGGGRSSAAIQTLLDQVDRVQNKFTQISAQGSPAEFNLKVNEQSLTPMALAKTGIDKVKSSLIELGIGINNLSMRDLPGLIDNFKKIYERVADFLGPSLQALWNTISTQLVPALDNFWHKIIEPLLPVLGTLLVAAIWAVTNGLNLLFAILTPVINFIADHKQVVIDFALAFGTLALYMKFDAITSAFTNNMNTIMGSIGNVKGSVTTLFTKISGGTVMGGIAVAGALADIGLVAQAVQSVMGAINAMNNAKKAADNEKSSNAAVIQQMQELEKTGTPQQRAQASVVIQQIQGTYGQFATGGFTGRGNANEVAGIVHKGEYVIPQSGVNQNTGQPMSTGSGDIHIHVNAGTVVGANGMQELANTIYMTLQRTARANGFNGALPNIGVAPTG